MKKALVIRSILFALLWWVLAEGRHDGWALGAVAVFAATWASLRLLPPGDHPIRIAGLIHFLSFFLWHSVRGGIQVAGMAFRGRTALQPGLIEFSVNLPPGGPRILLTKTLGLMPGTVGVELSGMVAPAPVSALLHAVAVVKAGAFGIVRIVYEVYGIEFAQSLNLLLPLAIFAAVTIVWGSSRALFQDDLKKRLALSTVSQVSYIVLGVALFGPIGTFGDGRCNAGCRHLRRRRDVAPGLGATDR